MKKQEGRAFRKNKKRQIFNSERWLASAVFLKALIDLICLQKENLSSEKKMEEQKIRCWLLDEQSWIYEFIPFYPGKIDLECLIKDPKFKIHYKKWLKK